MENNGLKFKLCILFMLVLASSTMASRKWYVDRNGDMHIGGEANYGVFHSTGKMEWASWYSSQCVHIKRSSAPTDYGVFIENYYDDATYPPVYLYQHSGCSNASLFKAYALSGITMQLQNANAEALRITTNRETGGDTGTLIRILHDQQSGMGNSYTNAGPAIDISYTSNQTNRNAVVLLDVGVAGATGADQVFDINLTGTGGCYGMHITDTQTTSSDIIYMDIGSNRSGSCEDYSYAGTNSMLDYTNTGSSHTVKIDGKGVFDCDGKICANTWVGDQDGTGRTLTIGTLNVLSLITAPELTISTVNATSGQDHVYVSSYTVVKDSLTIKTTDTSDPTICFETTNSANKLYFQLDESATDDHVDFVGQTPSVNTRFHVIAQSGESAYSGVQQGSYRGEMILGGSGHLTLQNVAEDCDVLLKIDDGGTDKTITWDADVDKLKHSSGLFDFDNDSMTTTGHTSFGSIQLTGIQPSALVIDGHYVAVGDTATMATAYINGADDMYVKGYFENDLMILAQALNIGSYAVNNGYFQNYDNKPMYSGSGQDFQQMFYTGQTPDRMQEALKTRTTVGNDGWKHLIHWDSRVSVLTSSTTDSPGLVVWSKDLANNIVITATSTGMGYGVIKVLDGEGINIATNTYIIGYCSAPVYYGDGSNLTGISGTGQWTASGNDIYFEGGKVGIGTTTPSVELHIASNSSCAMRISRHDTTASGGNLQLARSSGTMGSPVTVPHNNDLGVISFWGFDGTSYDEAAAIIGEVAELSGWTASDHGARILFQTTPTGSTTKAVRMVIGSEGNVGIGTDITPNWLLDVQGAGHFDGNLSVSGTLSTEGLNGDYPHMLDRDYNSDFDSTSPPTSYSVIYATNAGVPDGAKAVILSYYFHNNAVFSVRFRAKGYSNTPMLISCNANDYEMGNIIVGLDSNEQFEWYSDDGSISFCCRFGIIGYFK